MTRIWGPSSKFEFVNLQKFASVCQSIACSLLETQHIKVGKWIPVWCDSQQEYKCLMRGPFISRDNRYPEISPPQLSLQCLEVL